MNILIIGNGRCAKHMTYYLASRGHQITHWHYKTHDASALKTLSDQAQKVLLLIRDSAILGFLEVYPYLRTVKTIHFSGALEIEGIQNIHPLVSFSFELFPIEFYEKIPFACFENPSEELSSFIPGLENPSFWVPKKAKALYHGLCVASGNLMTHLWQLVGHEFTNQLAVPPDFLVPYLHSITANLESNWHQALTGPISRRDEQTLAKNYSALAATPLKQIFEAHVKLAWPEFADKYFYRP